MTAPLPQRPDAAISRRFSRQVTTGTRPELLLRRALHARGLRFRVEFRIAGLPRRRVDIALTRPKLAVLVDGCFWHSCPEHGVIPKTNTDWWVRKLTVNRDRDRDTDAKLAAAGWTVLRIWEHTAAEEAADLVEKSYRELLSAP